MISLPWRWAWWIRKMRSKKAILIISVLAVLAFMAWRFVLGLAAAPTGQAKLTWNPSDASDLKGYRIYYDKNKRSGDCPPGGYGKKLDVGKNTSYQIGGLENGSTYYFSVTSYDTNGKESCFSQEMNKTVKVSFWERIRALM